MVKIFLYMLLLAAPLFAQDGQQLYTLYCSACHAADGKGATGGAFPPLSGSAWVNGDADRAVKIVLHGLEGPVDVLGKTYNLAMPPQGAVLPDDQIAAILTYVRTSWDNQSSAVTADFVKSIRAATLDRKVAWTAGEILKLHPLPLEKTALSHLISQVYSGDWSAIPDFSTLSAENIEEEHDGIISIADSTLKDHFAMVWQGDFEAPSNGEYAFLLDADDAAKIIIDGQKVMEIDGSGPMNGSRSRQKKVPLTKGPHKIRIEYLEITGDEGIAIGWKVPGEEIWKWLTKDTVTVAKIRVPIPIGPEKDRPVIYRNFITGTTARAIGVGFPGGLNLAYSADHLAPELIWTGLFMDGGAKWIDRGTDSNPPAGENMITLGKSRTLPAAARFLGYTLDPAGNPSFRVGIGEQILLDSWQAGTHDLVRTLTLTGSGAALDFQLGEMPHDLITIGGKPLESLDGRATLKLTPGQPITLTYHFKK